MTGFMGFPYERLQQVWKALDARVQDRTLPKMAEYGAFDLVKLGQALRRAGVRDSIVLPRHRDYVDAELGIYFYLEGKMARWGEAVADGRLPDVDTLFDIEVYARMARINRLASIQGVHDLPEEEFKSWLSQQA